MIELFLSETSTALRQMKVEGEPENVVTFVGKFISALLADQESRSQSMRIDSIRASEQQLHNQFAGNPERDHALAEGEIHALGVIANMLQLWKDDRTVIANHDLRTVHVYPESTLIDSSQSSNAAADHLNQPSNHDPELEHHSDLAQELILVS